MLSDLSDLYVRNFDYYQALRTLQNLEKISPAADKPKIERRMVKLIEDIYLNNQADNLSALKSLALYQDYNWLPPKAVITMPLSKNWPTVWSRLTCLTGHMNCSIPG